nr:pathogenesis-related protein 1c [Allium sativum]
MGSISSYNSVLPLLFLLAIVVAPSAYAQNSPQDFVNAHNSVRAQVGVGPVSWDQNVAAYAQSYANQRAGDCKLIHSGGPYGENIFWGSSTGFTGVDAVNSWASEKQYYHYDSNTCDPGQVCGHYTQVVWANSVNIGCARVVCNNNGGVFIICSYNPPGNYIGQRPY